MSLAAWRDMIGGAERSRATAEALLADAEAARPVFSVMRNERGGSYEQKIAIAIEGNGEISVAIHGARLEATDAVRFGQWLLDTFGEVPR